MNSLGSSHFQDSGLFFLEKPKPAIGIATGLLLTRLRPPPMFVEIDAVLRHERDALAAQPLLHDPGRFEVALAGEHPVAVHHAVAGQVGAHRLVERPADGAGGPSPPEVLSNVAVGGNPTRGNPGDDGPDAFEK